MKNFFFGLLPLVALIFIGTFSSCETDLDDVNRRIDELGERLTELERQVADVNYNIGSLEQLIDGIKMGGAAISNIERTSEGYVITLTNGEVIILKHGESPTISVEYDTETGEYCWKLNGEFLLDGDGNKIPVRGKDGVDGENGEDGADAISPRLEIGANLTGKDADGNDFEDTAWYISVDDGTTWVRVTGSASELNIQSIIYAGSEVVIRFGDGTELRIPLQKDFVFAIAHDGMLNFRYGETISLNLTMSNIADSHAIAKPDGWKAEIKGTQLIITAPTKANATEESGEVCALAVSTTGYSAMAKVEVRIYDEGDDDDSIDLSEHYIANSYIVTESGEYKFFARRPDPSSTAEEAGTQAAWIWMTGDNDLLVIESLRYDAMTRYIHFEVEHFEKGSALIALLNANGRILWSWHIWFHDGLNIDAAGSEFMNHNLGASSNDRTDTSGATIGFYYQWGRKDAMAGANATTGGNENPAFSSLSDLPRINDEIYTKVWDVLSDDQTGDLEMLLQYPTVFINRGAGIPTSTDTLWGELMDPCPAGWRMPDADELGSYFTSLTEVGTYFGSETVTGDWIPYGASRTTNGYISSLGTQALYWTNKGENTYDKKTISHISFGYHFQLTYGNIIAASVRCIKR